MSPAIWPVIIAILAWLIVRFTGNETHAIDGIIFAAAVIGTISIIVVNARRTK